MLGLRYPRGVHVQQVCDVSAVLALGLPDDVACGVIRLSLGTNHLSGVGVCGNNWGHCRHVLNIVGGGNVNAFLSVMPYHCYGDIF